MRGMQMPKQSRFHDIAPSVNYSVCAMHYMYGEKYLFPTITAMMLTDFYILN